MHSIFSVDVEDWFHILDVPSAPEISAWRSLPSRLEANFRRLLELFREYNVRATCFFLGYMAEMFPHLVTEADSLGHEVASHTYAHRLAYQMSCREFREDAQRARKLLEDIIGKPVLGYRSAGFSVTDKTPWFFDALAEAGYCYDSSVFPASRGHGGMSCAKTAPHVIETPSGRLIEFPITVTKLLGKPVCLFGGGYLRFFPYPLVRRMSHRVLREGRPVVFYIHPREIDPTHPRLPMGLKRRFKSYYNLASTEPKLRRILKEFPLTTFRDYLANDRSLNDPSLSGR